MRVGVVDIGTNSTRLLVADVDADGRLTELERHSRVTRLGQGVDATGALAQEAMERVFAVLTDYRRLMDEHGVETTTAVLTSAVRDASNGQEFTEAVKTRFGLDARAIPGEEEAALTFLGATSERPAPGATSGDLVVIDIGGGSTEFVVGHDPRDVAFFTSLQMGVVRMTERHLHHDPPHADELQALAQDARRVLDAGLPAPVRSGVAHAVAVAGTATSTAAIDLALEPYDPSRTHGHVLPLAALEEQLARLAQMTNDERREVAGLHPDRAPTIVAGVALLIECLRAFALDRVEVSEHDILRGAALQKATS
jgi:exopolyphosphatase / guanosine-5'-triphosphate,3'-diphosphate pyrophosphatase